MLHKLPDELILEIIKWSELIGSGYRLRAFNRRPMGILETLCLVNKRMNRLVTPRLYRKVSTNGGLGSHIHEFLLAIVRNRSLANHVQSLSLHWSDLEDKLIDRIPLNYDEDGYSDSDFGIDRFKDVPGYRNRKTKEEIEERARARARKPYPLEKIPEFEEFYQAALEIGLDTSKFERVNDGSKSAMALILLAILPELRDVEIELPHHAGLFEDFEFLLKTKLPRKLETVGLDLQNMFREEPTREGYNVRATFPFLLLPSIRIATARRTLSGGFPQEWIAKSYGKSSVEEINLFDAIIEPQILTYMLKIPCSLKRLTYQSVDDGDEDITRRVFGQALSCVSHTLEYLALDFEMGHHDDVTLLGSLSHFKALKTLSIAFDDIMGEPSRSSSLISTPTSHSSVSSANSTNTRFSSSLVDVLPATLEELIIKEGRSWGASDYIAAIRQLLLDKHTSKKLLPRLTRIGIGRNGRNYAGVVDLDGLVGFAKEVGVSIGRMTWSSGDVYVFKELGEQEDSAS